MSAVTRVKRTGILQIGNRKGGEPIVCLTAYTTQMARTLDPPVDLLLVGDSLGMVLYGFDSTLPVTLDMMIAHGAAVEAMARAVPSRSSSKAHWSPWRRPSRQLRRFRRSVSVPRRL